MANGRDVFVEEGGEKICGCEKDVLHLFDCIKEKKCFMSDSRNFDDFFRAFLNPCTAFIERMMGSKAEAEDLAQDVFLRVWEHWGEFETEENAKAFLYTTARNVCVDRMRRRQAEGHYVARCLKEGSEEEPAFLEEVMRQETWRLLHDAIAKLPGQTRQVIQLGMEGHTNEKVGELMGVSVNTVKTLKKNAYAALRDVLSKEHLMLVVILCGNF